MKIATISLGIVFCLLEAHPAPADQAATPEPASQPAATQAAPPMSADQATALFNRLYAQDIKKALAKGNVAENVKLAAQLLNSAKTSAMDQPALLTLLCSNAYDLGAKSPAGYATAVEAIELLAEKVPESRVASLDKAVQLRQLAFGQARGTARLEAAKHLVDSLLALADAKLAAVDLAEIGNPARRAMYVASTENLPNKDDVKTRANVFIVKEQVALRLAGALTRLKTRPEDAAARNEIISTYIVEFDNPAEAARYLDASVDVTLRALVPLASRKVNELPETAALSLADWYMGLADKATELTRQPLLVHAKACYAQFLAVHKTKDAWRTDAEMALKKLDAVVPSATQPDQPADTVWIDLLKLETPGKSSGWEFKDGVLASQAEGRPIHIIPVVPDGSYELLVKFQSQFPGGDRSTIIYLPVGNSACVLYLSGDFSSVSDVKNKQQNDTTIRPGGIASGMRVVLAIRVMLAGENAEIAVRLNDTPFLHWKGPQADLSTSPDWGRGTKTLGVATGYARSQFDTIKLHMLTGTAKMPEKIEPPKREK